MKTRILVVDDDPNHRQTLGIELRLEGFEIDEAEDGNEALEKLDERDIDLAIVDLMMPGINGLELARRMGFRHPGVRVVLTSAYHLSERQLERANAGAVGFVPKPYRIEDLVSFVREKLETPNTRVRL